jgi:hypothetical protein
MANIDRDQASELVRHELESRERNSEAYKLLFEECMKQVGKNATPVTPADPVNDKSQAKNEALCKEIASQKKHELVDPD